MSRVCIIPARGGSKRLPRKNVLPLAGRPMIEWPARAAQECGLFDRIIVSTEDADISAIAKKAGVEIHKRPAELAGDRTTVVEVCLNVLDELEGTGVEIEEFCCLYATAAFVRSNDLVEAHGVMQGPPPADFVMCVSEYELSPLLALQMEDDGELTPMWPEYHGLQSQDYPRLVCSNGTFYWGRLSAFRKVRSFYGPPLKSYVLPRARTVDMDTPEDYQEAQRRADMLRDSEQASQ